MNSKIIFLVNVKVRIDRGFRREADTDNVSTINPLDFGKKYCIEIQPVPFRRNLPKVNRVDFVALRHAYLE